RLPAGGGAGRLPRVGWRQASAPRQADIHGLPLLAGAELCCIDLRALELARVVDVDRLPLGEDVERRLTCLTVSVPRVLRAAKRQVHLGADRAGVDVGDAGLEVAHRPERAVDVAREDRRRQAEAN